MFQFHTDRNVCFFTLAKKCRARKKSHLRPWKSIHSVALNMYNIFPHENGMNVRVYLEKVQDISNEDRYSFSLWGERAEAETWRK